MYYLNFLCPGADIQFWRNNKSMEGLSARTVIISFVSQVIVLLYLLDNETSWMIIISAAVGCVIEFWKIGRAMDISVRHLPPTPMSADWPLCRGGRVADLKELPFCKSAGGLYGD